MQNTNQGSLYKKGRLLAEGKTKKIWEVEGDDSLIIIENKPDITAFDNSAFTKRFDTKAVYATATTCRVFELLREAGLPIAYTEQISETEFAAPKCEMIPLEVVARRYAVGSYLKRNPDLQETPPYRFHKLVTEFFLKTTNGELKDKKGDIIVSDLDSKAGEEDPLIFNPRNTLWTLCHKERSIRDKNSILRENVPAKSVLEGTSIDEIERMLIEVFLIIEGMWMILGHRFIDLKIEFGITGEGKLVVADVIDNDSWRLRDKEWEELSKESFRQQESLEKVERKYEIVSDLTAGFRIPEQCIVLWRGSEKDCFPEISDDIAGLTIEYVTASGHKSPQTCLQILEKLLAKYPDGGVIIAKVGLSNGLGPTLAARTSWTVISIPATVSNFPDDIWSSLRMPSNVPMPVILSEGNAVLSAYRILAQKNPILYKELHRDIEQLDL